MFLLSPIRVTLTKYVIIIIMGVAERLRRCVLNHARSTCVGSNPAVRAINHKPSVNSAVHPSKVRK